jgi:FKBP-type peptidyl-prolyl cis-trans isomerase FkpA
MNQTARWLTPVLLIVLAAGCGRDDAAVIPPAQDPVELTYAPELAVDLTSMTKSPSGLYWQDLYEGSGSVARRNRTVTVEFTMWLHDGARVRGSADSGDNPRFTLGSDEILPAWNEGIEGMREGGRRKLVAPPHLAFGAAGSGAIPPNATLVMTIELLDVR